MKKLLAAFLAVLMLLSLTSCKNDKNEWALKIEGTEISDEIYTYFLDKVISRPSDYGLEENASEKSLRNAAVDECKRYISVNTEFVKMGLSLSSAEKVGISDEVNNIWMRFENHYTKIGVSKQTVTKICTAKAYEKAIFTELYDRGAQDAAAEEEIKNYFYENYTAFITVCVYFNSSDGVSPMTQLEINELLAAFNTLAAVPAGTPESFSESVQALGYTPSSTVILKKGSDGYPEGFFDKVYAQTDSTVQIIQYEDCVFAVFKENLKNKGDSVYANYRTVCINELYADENNTRIENNIKNLDVKENDEVINEIYNSLKT